MNQATRIFFTVLRLVIAIALLIYLSVSGAINWAGLKGLMVAWPITLLALLLFVVDLVVTAWRLCVLMKPCGLNLALSRSVRLCLIGTFFNACLPGSTSGDIVKIYYATAGNRGRRIEVATIMLLDRAAGMFGLVLWPLLAAPFFPRLLDSFVLSALLWAATIVLVAMILGLLVASSPRVKHIRVVSWALQNLPLGMQGARVLDTLREYRGHTGSLLAALGISLLAHTLTVVVILLIAQATNPSGFAWEISFLVPLGFLANTLPLTPGGLGVGEAAFNRLFAIAGLTGGAELLLGWRLLTILIGMSGLIMYLEGRKHFISESFPAQNAKQLSFP